MPSMSDAAISEMSALVRKEILATYAAGISPQYFVVADKRGKVIREYPTREYAGLEKLITTGYREDATCNVKTAT